MAMIRLGMGETGVTTTGEPTGVDKFLGGAKVWLNPSYITTEMAALWAGVKADAVGTLTSPRALGFLLVPAAVLAVVWGMQAAKSRRRNPRRAVRRRRANPRRKRVTGPIVHSQLALSQTMAQAQKDADRTGRPVNVKVRERGSRGRPRWVLYDTVYPGRTANPKRRRNAGAGSIRHTAKPKRAMWKRIQSETGHSRKTLKRHAKSYTSRFSGKRSRSRGTHRVKNGRSYAVRGTRPTPGYVPGPGKVFYLSGRKGIVRSVAPDERGVQYVWFRRPVDGTTGMSLANFRQAAYVE